MTVFISLTLNEKNQFAFVIIMPLRLKPSCCKLLSWLMPLSTSLLVIKLKFTLPGLILCEAVKFLAGELTTVEPIIVEFLTEESIVKFVSGVSKIFLK